MTKDQILNEINSNVYYCAKAHEAVYRGKVFAVKNGDIKFFKTKRGAEGYIKRQQLVVYYDEMIMEMRSCGDGAEIFEIKENELKRPSKKTIEAFEEILKSQGIEVTVRREMGTDINAACGQLRRSYIDTQK